MNDDDRDRPTTKPATNEWNQIQRIVYKSTNPMFVGMTKKEKREWLLSFWRDLKKEKEWQIKLLHLKEENKGFVKEEIETKEEKKQPPITRFFARKPDEIIATNLNKDESKKAKLSELEQKKAALVQEEKYVEAESVKREIQRLRGDALIARSQPPSLPNSFHFDTYNAQYVDKKELTERICPFCYVSFATKAAMLRHRRNQHRNKRAKDDAFDDINLELDALRQRREEEIAKIVHFDGSQYLCAFQDGSSEWLTMDETNEHVVAYKQLLAEQPLTVEMIQDKDAWINFFADMNLVESESDSDFEKVDEYHVWAQDKEKLKELKKKNTKKRTRKERRDEDACGVAIDPANHNKHIRRDEEYTDDSDWDNESLSSDEENNLGIMHANKKRKLNDDY